MSEQAEYIEMMFKLMEYDNLTDGQHDLICDFERHFKNFGKLSDNQIGILEDIFQKAAEKIKRFAASPKPIKKPGETHPVKEV